MSAAAGRRLSGSGAVASGAPIRFMFEGQPVEALEGETIAAALTAAGHVALRETGQGRETRGLYCGMGACQDCLVEIDGRGAQRACMTKVGPGLDIRRHAAARAGL
ncbi:MAG: (2Fe-2S)-binding protein, partial [Devosia sp.]